jgi:DNA-binding GntR family transcriptional regulator
VSTDSAGLAGLGNSLHRRGSADQLADEIVERIVSGQIRPGASLREAALADAGGVSRNTARETLRILIAGGLVQHYPQRGAVVCELSPDDIRDIYRLRKMMELEGVRAAGHLRPEQEERLSQAVADFDAAAASKDVARFVAADIGFHSRIVELAESPRLNRFYRSVANEVRFGFSVVSVHDREIEQPGPLVEEHRQICLHLIQGDTTAAADLLTAHLTHFGERLYEVFCSLDDDRENTATSGHRDEKRVSAVGPVA